MRLGMASVEAASWAFGYEVIGAAAFVAFKLFAVFVTWIATLHPENADVTIDQRFFVSGNPWWAIYEDIPFDTRFSAFDN